MPERLDEQLDQVSQRKALFQSLNRKLPRIKEEWGHAAYSLQQLEAQLDQINEQIDDLDSLSLTGLIAGIAGNKQGKLDALTDQAMVLEKQCDEVAQQVVDLDQQVEQMQSQIDELQDVDTEYQELIQQKRNEIMESGTEEGEVLRAAAEEMELLTTMQSELIKAVESAQRLTERLFSMTHALGRAYKKKMMPRAMGAFGFMIFDGFHRKGTDPAIKRVCEGMAEFSQCITRLSLTDSEFDQEIFRLGLVMDAYHTQLSAGSVDTKTNNLAIVDPMLEQVQITQGHLETKLEQTNQEIIKIENEQQTLVGG